MAKLTLIDWIRMIFGGGKPKAQQKAPEKRAARKKVKRKPSRRLRPRKMKPKLSRKISRKTRSSKKKVRKAEAEKVTPISSVIETPTRTIVRPMFGGLFRRGAAAKMESTRPLPKRLPKEIVKEFIASDIMTRKVVTVRNDDSLSYVVRLLSEKQISGAPVLNRNGNLIGTVSEADIVAFVGSSDLLDAQTNRLDRLKETKVEEIMKKGPLTVLEHTPIHEINDMINKHGAARVTVVDDRRDVAGIITRGDMVRGISKEMLMKIIKPREIEKSEIDTDVDDVLEIVDRRGTITIEEIKQKLNLPENKIEEWGRMLEKHSLIEIFYPPIGRPSFRKRVK